MSEVKLEPGRPLSSSERDALRRDNERETREAQQRAKEQNEADVRNGRRPVVTEVAETLKQKMVDQFGEDGRK